MFKNDLNGLLGAQNVSPWCLSFLHAPSINRRSMICTGFHWQYGIKKKQAKISYVIFFVFSWLDFFYDKLPIIIFDQITLHWDKTNTIILFFSWINSLLDSGITKTFSMNADQNVVFYSMRIKFFFDYPSSFSPIVFLYDEEVLGNH